MSLIHSQLKHIPEFEIGDMEHVEYQNYIRWMREMTQEHFSASGFSREYFVNLGKCFVVRRHSVEHLAPCFLNDTLLLVTWISEQGNRMVKRQHRIYKVDSSGNRFPIVSAENLAVFVDIHVKPSIIPQEIAEVLTPVSEDEVTKHISELDIDLKNLSLA